METVAMVTLTPVTYQMRIHVLGFLGAVKLQRILGGQVASQAPTRLPQNRFLDSGRCLLIAAHGTF